MSAAAPNWPRLFPDEDYGFHFGVHRGPARGFFNSTVDHDRLLADRKKWLSQDIERYAQVLPEGESALAETAALFDSWDLADTTSDSPIETCLELGRQLEPDFVLMTPNESETFVMVGGCVCFPSSWRLTDKLRLPLTAIHEPVPGLNQSLGDAIDRFLHTLKPDSAALRSNWGISRSAELNHHPDLPRPQLTPPLTEDEVFIRIENQALVALPESGGVLFGIRLEIIPLPEFKLQPAAVKGLRRALRTMPEEVAKYKNLSAARDSILELLA